MWSTTAQPLKDVKEFFSYMQPRLYMHVPDILTYLTSVHSLRQGHWVIFPVWGQCFEFLSVF